MPRTLRGEGRGSRAPMGKASDLKISLPSRRGPPVLSLHLAFLGIFACRGRHGSLSRACLLATDPP